MNNETKDTKKMSKLFSAPQVAKFCSVSLKTIHNWAKNGEIQNFKTPGGRLKFQRKDVFNFMNRIGYPIPEEIDLEF